MALMDLSVGIKLSAVTGSKRARLCPHQVTPPQVQLPATLRESRQSTEHQLAQPFLCYGLMHSQHVLLLHPDTFKKEDQHHYHQPVHTVSPLRWQRQRHSEARLAQQHQVAARQDDRRAWMVQQVIGTLLMLGGDR